MYAEPGSGLSRASATAKARREFAHSQREARKQYTRRMATRALVVAMHRNVSSPSTRNDHS